jgi:hypothetical protein
MPRLTPHSFITTHHLIIIIRDNLDVTIKRISYLPTQESPPATPPTLLLNFEPKFFNVPDFRVSIAGSSRLCLSSSNVRDANTYLVHAGPYLPSRPTVLGIIDFWIFRLFASAEKGRDKEPCLADAKGINDSMQGLM